ncbi:GNAT family N-acetyltransferase [Lentzea sp. CA-135723]|uniref:GNAT family N-acetyltransferase n=1 Tax=Lentzea sp. CA-135723 TaxID=3239950 RepID=UPI003D8ECA19
MITRPPVTAHVRTSANPSLSWVGRKVWLREVAPADRKTLTRFDRDEHPPLVGGYRHWAAHRADTTGEDLQLAIVSLRSRVLVGSLTTVRTDSGPGWFSYGVGIGSWHSRCGYAADAITVLLALMFGQRGYRACEISINGGNFASQSLHTRLGFRETGLLADPDGARGSFGHLVTMSISAAEFAARHPGLALPLQADGPGRGRHWRRLRGRHRQRQPGHGGA